jgi:DNA repair exonuclease SbcCD nuclease subunit
MKIAIFLDTHLGYARFEGDSYAQAGRVLADASAKADLILCAGDVFDVKIPKLETLGQAISIFRSVKAPVYLIYGNHERRSKDLTNPVELLTVAANLTLLDKNSATFEKGGERVQVYGMGSVPEEYAEKELKAALDGFTPEPGAFKVLMLHQSVRELMPGGLDELSLKFLEPLSFDLIVNGHIHNTIVKLDGRFLIPGSTVITQLKKDETAPKGYFI